MGEVKFYSKNYVHADAIIAVSHNSAMKAKLYDWDRDSKWITSGANSDATEASVEVDFYEGTTAYERTINRIILLNHNLKSPTLEYWNGSAWASLASVSPSNPLASEHTLFTFTQVSTYKVRIRCSATQIADAEKFIGEMIVCNLLFDPGANETIVGSGDLNNYQVAHRQEAYEQKLGDGSIHRAVVKHSPYRSDKFEARFQLRRLDTDQFESFRSIKQTGQAFIFHPETSYKPEEIFYVNWVGGFRWRYSSTNKGAGYEIDFDLKEV